MNTSVYPVSSGLESYGKATVLIAASSEGGARRAARTIEAAGLPLFSVSLDEAVTRLDRQGAASALWIELEEDVGPSLDRLLDRVAAEVSAGSFPAVVAAPGSLIDPVVARVSDKIELVIDGSPIERIEALSLALARSRQDNRGVNEDISSEPSPARLRQLSDEVSRIAATLARLSTGPGAGVSEQPEPPSGDVPQVSLDEVRQVIRARRLRARYFEEELFADPAWDMLLDLFQAEIAQHRVPVSSLCIAASVPATMALRWIKTMTDAGLFKRRADPHDGRRVFVELAPKASDAMRRYFAEAGKVIVV